MSRRPLLGPLGVRLALAFLTVAVAAIAVLAALIMMSARNEVSGLTDRQREDDLNATAIAAGDAYQRTEGWTTANLAGAAAVAARSQATLTIVDADGEVVAAPTDALASMMTQMHGVAAVDTPRGRPGVGRRRRRRRTRGRRDAAVPHPSDGSRTPRPRPRCGAHRHTRCTHRGGCGHRHCALRFGAGHASVTALTTAAGDLAAGRRDTRVDADGPGELRTLAEAFNEMADQLDREDRLRRNLVADVAHELRTPLAILQGSTEALLDGVDEPTPDVLGSLNDEVTRLRRLVGDLETLAAAEAAGLRPREDRVDLADVATAAADLLRPLADDRGTTLTAKARPAAVIGDTDRLHQIAVNLIANAVKFTPAGGAITISTSSDEVSACLEIVDNGPGIPEQELPHVFERFWRGANGDKATGSGIGLAVVAELVAAHHGTVSAGNVPGGGARFRITLPTAPPA